MAKYIDVSSWVNHEWSSPSKGSRPQKILSDPESEKEFFFKESTIKFPSEFWSEVIASKIGITAGFDVLPYHVAKYHRTLGCLSESMTPNPLFQLYHGVDILRDFIPDFEMTEKPIHSFQQLMFLCETNENFKSFKRKFIDMIVFDALIGNSDRHTENWAFLQMLTFEPQESGNLVLIPIKKDFWYYYSIIMNKPIKHNFQGDFKLEVKRNIVFSPIYDSGSCLGREFEEDRIQRFVTDEKKVEKYLNRGPQEIHWNGTKLNCFDIISNISGLEPVILKESLITLFQNLNEDLIRSIIDRIDENIIGKVDETFLSLQRKSLIKTLLLARFKRLKEIFGVS